MSYSCSELTTHIWTGSAFTGMCPTATPIADGITLVASDRREGDELECGIFNATVTSITTGVGVMRIDSNLTFTPTTTVPTNGSVVVCQDGLQMELERHTINIQGEKKYQVMGLSCKVNMLEPREGADETRMNYLALAPPLPTTNVIPTTSGYLHYALGDIYPPGTVATTLKVVIQRETRGNCLMSQVKFLGLAHAFVTM